MTQHLKPALFAHAEALLRRLLAFDHPADALVSSYFREHRQLGHNDRALVAETLYAVLRRLRSLEACCPPEVTPRRLLLAALVTVRGWNLRELAPVLRGPEENWLAACLGADRTLWPAAVQADLPDWLHERLLAQYGADHVQTLAQALNQPAPLDLRVNTLKARRDDVLTRLSADGIAARAGDLSPWAIRLAGKPPLSRHPLFLDGSIEVQDEGSQLLGQLLDPRRGELVVDFCAGAGGKTLLLGAMMRNTGRLYALDVSDRRLANLKPRLARSGLSNVHPMRLEHERDARLKRLAGKADRVLVDAPCSGLGTLRRNPDLKWRQTPAAIEELQAKQQAILEAAARLVKPGGRLVYATCSLLAEENERVVTTFLDAHPAFSCIPLPPGMPATAHPGHLVLLPQCHGTDGFFAALMERQG